ncbi:MAG: hypothetical protein IPH94_17705 [Saprospiraceae bacterium]|nr:hypothetical protein [Saprospiraceae bacterium]MBK7223078.1 hypothetical protein [Saprospiraceae bacterium]MBK7789417.1 hypothetical protein [Saprospiraceae bacterium]MBK8112807.1 hypothetical protein [Saprospiraceae bacterium]MBK8852373.1 hypothetical protein [Saprospiraceae bacterium]
MVKILAWIFIFFNVYMGGNFFLNAIGILQDSKYGVGATRLYAVLLLAMAGASVYFMFVKSNAKMALWIGAGAWVLIFFILLANMIFGKYN